MHINLGALALVGTLGLGAGAAAQYGVLPAQRAPEAQPPQEQQQQQQPQVDEMHRTMPHATDPADPSVMGDPREPVTCEALRAQHQQTIDELDTLDRALDELAMTMRQVTGHTKMEATAAVVDALVTQRKQIRETTMRTQHDVLLFMSQTPPSSPEFQQCLTSMADMAPTEGHGPDDQLTPTGEPTPSTADPGTQPTTPQPVPDRTPRPVPDR